MKNNFFHKPSDAEQAIFNHHLKLSQMELLLKKLAEKGGKIVSSSSCSVVEIAQAQACNRMYVDEAGLGFIWIPEKPEISTTIYSS